MAVESLSRDLYGDKLKNKKIDELNLEETNDALGALQKYCEDLGGVAREDREELDALQAHIQKLESGSSQSSTEKSEFKSMNVSDATAYLKGLKDKSWSDVSKEGSKRVGAVQVVLKDKGYDVGEIDGVLGKSKSKTRAAVRKFQIASGFKGKNIDGVPGPITIKAIFGEKVSDAVKSGSSEKLTEGQEDKVTNWTRSGVDGSFTGTTKVKGGEQQPWNGEFTLKDGSKVEIKDGNMQS